MKKTLLLIGLTLGFLTGFSQAELRLSPQTITTDKNGGTIQKGDTVLVALAYRNNNSTNRNFYFDFQHQTNALTLLDLSFPALNAAGSALPNGTTYSYQNNYYPNNYWISNPQNKTEDGLTNYQNAQYGSTAPGTGINSINRVYIQYATNGGNVVNLRDGDLAYLRFRVLNTPAGFSYDSIYLNFVYAFDRTNTIQNVKMPKPASAWVGIEPGSNALINGTLQVNGNLTGQLQPYIVIVDSATNQIVTTTQASLNGSFVLSSELQPNKGYYAYVAINGTDISQTLTSAVTVSDYSAAAFEFINQNLDGTYNNTNLQTGMSWLASDVDFNKVFNAGDLNLLFSQAVGSDTIIESEQNMYNVPAFLSEQFDNLQPNEWRELTDIYGIYFRTTDVAQPLSLKYFIPGDINRSHSSQVVRNGNVITNAKSSLSTSGILNQAANMGVLAENVNPVDVSLNNLTVTSSDIQIPVNINTNGNNLSGIQFEFIYDPTKVKFEELKSQVSNQWAIYVNSKAGTIRFAALDAQFKYPITGSSTPFTLRFSAIGNALDIDTYIKIRDNYDAADNKGNQLSISLNTSAIKLTGYHKFN